jgi:hypothetical protein
VISRYNIFFEDRLFENLVNESFIYYTKNFKDALNKLKSKSKIAQDLISVENTDVKPDMTFIDISDREGYFSFSQIKKAVDNFKKSTRTGTLPQDTIDSVLKSLNDGTLSDNFDKELLYTDYGIKGNSRNDAKIGKLVTQIFPKKYTDKEVEEFVNLFKKVDSIDNFEIVYGEDIIKWYLVENYGSESGELGNSCMRHRRCSSYLKIYSENPEICRMLILKNDEGDKILGRALIWRINTIFGKDSEGKNVEYFLDRIYAINDATKLLFQNYADKNGWLKRTTSRYNDCKDFTLGDVDYHDVTIEIELDKSKFDRYPYMDTFKRLIKERGVLVNDEDEDEKGCYILTTTDGGYIDTSGVWSEWYDERIPEEDAVYSDPLGTWILRDDCIEVEVGRRSNIGLYPSDYDRVIKDCVTDKWIHRNDSFYSEYYQDRFLEDDVIDVITWVNEESSLDNCRVGIEALSDKDDLISPSQMECMGYLEKNNIYDQITKNIVKLSVRTNKYYFSDLSVKVFVTPNGDFSETDCRLLNIDVKNLKSYYTDILAYNYNLDIDDKKKLIDLAQEEVNRLENLISGKQGRLVFDEKDDIDYIRNSSIILRGVKYRLGELKKWI